MLQGVVLKGIAIFELMILVGKLLTLEHCSFYCETAL